MIIEDITDKALLRDIENRAERAQLPPQAVATALLLVAIQTDRKAQTLKAEKAQLPQRAPSPTDPVEYSDEIPDLTLHL